MTLRDLTPWFGRNALSAKSWSENPFESLHREVDRMLGDFLTGTDLSP